MSLDTSAAFDTIDHSTLLNRLQVGVGFSVSALTWLSPIVPTDIIVFKYVRHHHLLHYVTPVFHRAQFWVQSFSHAIHPQTVSLQTHLASAYNKIFMELERQLLQINCSLLSFWITCAQETSTVNRVLNVWYHLQPPAHDMAYSTCYAVNLNMRWNQIQCNTEHMFVKVSCIPPRLNISVKQAEPSYWALGSGLCSGTGLGRLSNWARGC